MSKKDVKADDVESSSVDTATEFDWKAYWTDKWQPQSRKGWFMEKSHPLLTNYSELSKAVGENQRSLKIFVPLCGNSLDLLYLAEKGHDVVGLEGMMSAAEQFMSENKLTYETQVVTSVDGYVLKVTGMSLRIYVCDIYNFSRDIEGPFDMIWDRMSLVTLDPGERTRYVESMLSLTTDDFSYLLVTMEYDPVLGNDRPFYFSEQQIETLYGNQCSIKFMEKYLFDPQMPRPQRFVGKDFGEKLYLLTRKKITLADDNKTVHSNWKEEWSEKWLPDHKQSWHEKTGSELLKKHWDALKPADSKRPLKIFVPLCGKSLDLLFFAKQGHHVVGVEGILSGAEIFMSENKLNYTTHQVEAVSGQCLTAEGELSLKIYVCDLLDFSCQVENNVDVVWDRGSFVAIYPSDRVSYVKLMKSIINDRFTYLLASMEYDRSFGNKRPYCFSEDELQSYFGEYCNVQFIDYCRVPMRHKGEGPPHLVDKIFGENLYLLTPKSTK